MLVAVEQARSMAMFAAVMAAEENPIERRKAISAAKVQIGRSARHVGQEAIQLHGGIGMTNEYAVGHYFKRVTMIDQLFGDADTHLSLSCGAWRPVRQGRLSSAGPSCSTWTAPWRTPARASRPAFATCWPNSGMTRRWPATSPGRSGRRSPCRSRTLLAKYGDDRVDLGLATYRARYSTSASMSVPPFPASRRCWRR